MSINICYKKNNIINKLQAAKEFREWQSAFIKHYVSGLLASQRGAAEGGGGISNAHVWVRTLFQDY